MQFTEIDKPQSNFNYSKMVIFPLVGYLQQTKVSFQKPKLHFRVQLHAESNHISIFIVQLMVLADFGCTLF